MRPCLDDEEMFALVDGAASEKDAGLWRKHIAGCERCTKSLATLEHALATIAEDEPLDASAHADAVMTAIDRQERVAKRSTFRPALFGGLALAAALLLGIGFLRPHADAEFTARGGVQGEALHRDIAIAIRANGKAIAAGDELALDTRFDAVEHNLGREPAYALVFAVDAKLDVHWIYPAYESAGTDPASVKLVAGTLEDHALGSAVAFDNLAPGALSLVTVLSPQPLRVSQIESRGAALTADDLRRAFPGADVRVVAAHVQ